MTRRDLWAHKRYLDYLFKKSEELKGNEELLAHWTKYLCVLVTGWLEEAIYEIYSEYTEKKSHKNVSRYVTLKLKRFRNPKMGNIRTLVSDFNSDWGEEFDAITIGEIKDAVDSIVSNRHLITHGRSCNMSLRRLTQYYEHAVKAVQFLESQSLR
ncbi:HEPN domain-containing protein [Candidatus Bathyarchaeota archaeon]|nr:HEPN domain-containing protein [Candidatus Bathyarchaeota archaeon]